MEYRMKIRKMIRIAKMFVS